MIRSTDISLPLIADPDYGDISDPINGRDVVVEFKTAEETGASFPKTSIRVKPNQTPITEDKDLLQNLFDNQSNLTELYTEPSYDDLKEALDNFFNPSEDGNDTTTTSNNVSATTTPTSNVGGTANKSTSNVEDAFDQLFNS